MSCTANSDLEFVYGNETLVKNRSYLSEVGKISGVYKKTIEKAPVIPNFPIVFNVVFRGSRETPASTNQQRVHVYKYIF